MPSWSLLLPPGTTCVSLLITMQGRLWLNMNVLHLPWLEVSYHLMSLIWFCTVIFQSFQNGNSQVIFLIFLRTKGRSHCDSQWFASYCTSRPSCQKLDRSVSNLDMIASLIHQGFAECSLVHHFFISLGRVISVSILLNCFECILPLK